MGRAERRRQERLNRINSKKDKMYLSRHEITEMKNETAKNTSHNNVEHLMTLFALVLNEKFGFDGDQIATCLEGIDEYSNLILNDEIDISTLIDKLRENTGIEILCKDE